jgi:hypothetical protein
LQAIDFEDHTPQQSLTLLSLRLVLAGGLGFDLSLLQAVPVAAKAPREAISRGFQVSWRSLQVG